MKRIYLLVLLVGGFFANAPAQTLAPAPPAPVPQAILSAKTIFISNAMFVIGNLSGGPARGYDQFYDALKAAGRFELVNDPSKADLVFELQTVPLDRIQNGIEGVRVLIYDRKTHYVLWTLIHPMQVCALKKGCDKNFDSAMDGLIRDLEALSGQSTSSNNH